jgi:hypothetical protein
VRDANAERAVDSSLRLIDERRFGFGSQAAATRLQTLLDPTAIPLAVPPGVVEMQAAILDAGAPGGVAATNAVRVLVDA